VSSTRKKILVVDDDPIILEVVRDRLEAAGHEVHIRDAALGTTQWVAENAPDFVLLDVSMPALSGRELGQLLKRGASTRNVGVILFSGLPQEELQQVVRASGAIGGISKSDPEDRFISELRRIMTRHNAGQS
jgi:two-component system alkaline phosphatase synthesis response regulator PhoP